MWDTLRCVFDSEFRKQRMLDVVHGVERKPKFPGVLDQRLLSYPPNSPVHAGAPQTLSDQQVDENFKSFINGKVERLKIFADLLNEFDVALAPLFDIDTKPGPVIAAVEHWMEDYLPERANLPPWASMVNSPYYLYEGSSRSGSEIVFSLAADYAIAVGEAIILRKPKWFWGVDRDPDNSPDSEDGGMRHYRRIVLMTAAKPDWPAAVADLDAAMLQVIYELRSRGPKIPHTAWWIDNVLAEEG
jgi:hypothetical protein